MILKSAPVFFLSTACLVLPVFAQGTSSQVPAWQPKFDFVSQTPEWECQTAGQSDSGRLGVAATLTLIGEKQATIKTQYNATIDGKVYYDTTYSKGKFVTGSNGTMDVVFSDFFSQESDALPEGYNWLEMSKSFMLLHVWPTPQQHLKYGPYLLKGTYKTNLGVNDILCHRSRFGGQTSQ